MTTTTRPPRNRAKSRSTQRSTARNTAPRSKAPRNTAPRSTATRAAQARNQQARVQPARSRTRRPNRHAAKASRRFAVIGRGTVSRSASKPLAVHHSGARLGALMSVVVVGLTLFGLVMVLSASSVTSLYQLDASPYFQFQRQLMWAALGAVSFLVTSRLDYRLLQRVAGPFLVLSMLLLVAVLIPGVGRNINGSSRWLGVGPVVFQPAEFAKLALIMFVADLLTRRAKQMDRSDLTIRPVLVVLAILGGLLLLQPKLGTPIVLASVAFMMLFVAGARIDHLMGWATVGAALATFFAYSAPYRRDRILAFLDPWADAQGFGLQTIQSQVGIASGGLLGVGLGAGRAKWGFLPYAHSDFIFAIVAEEVGLIGAAALILGFLMLGYLGMRAAIKAPDRFGMLLAAGLTSWLMIQAFLNIGMAIGQMPITGEPLPFVSAGGSSLLTTLTAAGVLTSVARRARA